MSNRADEERRRQERLARERVDARRSARRKELAWYAAIAGVLVVAALVVVVGVSPRGGGDSSSLLRPLNSGRAAAPAVPTTGVPRQIAANLKDGDEVIDGQVSRRLAALKGVPVVVNMWASWCPNCKAEFPSFQELSRKYDRRVAFLGLDSQDERGGAKDFLKQHPLSYPSVEDQERCAGAADRGRTRVADDDLLRPHGPPDVRARGRVRDDGRAGRRSAPVRAGHVNDPTAGVGLLTAVAFPIIIASGGLFLVAMGVLIWTGELFRLGIWAQPVMNDLHLNFFNEL